MMRVIVNGAMGRMGNEVIAQLRSETSEASLAAAVDCRESDGAVYSSLASFTGKADVIVDFTLHTATAELLDYAVSRNLPVVIATTGHTEDELAVIKAAAQQIPVFHASNMSIGVALLVQFARQAATAFPGADIEIVEAHHTRKKDAPSGTAMTLANAVAEVRPGSVVKCGRSGFAERDPNEITVHALRMGNIVGQHEIFITTDTQQLAIRHEAYDRGLFAEGALTAAAFLMGKPAGCYGMEDMTK